ncbi:hypothetical protein EF915_34935 [Streptomyces sp. WAC08401]|nr:hypothetical protein EF915_34935 [Streptomyces sp. WAC08401]
MRRTRRSALHRSARRPIPRPGAAGRARPPCPLPTSPGDVVHQGEDLGRWVRSVPRSPSPPPAWRWSAGTAGCTS